MPKGEKVSGIRACDGCAGPRPALSLLGDTQGALPYTVVIDRDGKLVESHHGKLDRAEFDALIAPYL